MEVFMMSAIVGRNVAEGAKFYLPRGVHRADLLQIAIKREMLAEGVMNTFSMLPVQSLMAAHVYASQYSGALGMLTESLLAERPNEKVNNHTVADAMRAMQGLQLRLENVATFGTSFITGLDYTCVSHFGWSQLPIEMLSTMLLGQAPLPFNHYFHQNWLSNTRASTLFEETCLEDHITSNFSDRYSVQSYQLMQWIGADKPTWDMQTFDRSWRWKTTITSPSTWHNNKVRWMNRILSQKCQLRLEILTIENVVGEKDRQMGLGNAFTMRLDALLSDVLRDLEIKQDYVEPTHIDNNDIDHILSEPTYDFSTRPPTTEEYKRLGYADMIDMIGNEHSDLLVAPRSWDTKDYWVSLGGEREVVDITTAIPLPTDDQVTAFQNTIKNVVFEVIDTPNKWAVDCGPLSVEAALPANERVGSEVLRRRVHNILGGKFNRMEWWTDNELRAAAKDVGAGIAVRQNGEWHLLRTGNKMIYLENEGNVHFKTLKPIQLKPKLESKPIDKQKVSEGVEPKNGGEEKKEQTQFGITGGSFAKADNGGQDFQGDQDNIVLPVPAKSVSLTHLSRSVLLAGSRRRHTNSLRHGLSATRTAVMQKQPSIWSNMRHNWDGSTIERKTDGKNNCGLVRRQQALKTVAMGRSGNKGR